MVGALFFSGGLPAAAGHLRRDVDRRAGGVLDEPATAQALAAFVLRGFRCGAVTDDEVTRLAGIDRGGLEALSHRRLG